MIFIFVKNESEIVSLTFICSIFHAIQMNLKETLNGNKKNGSHQYSYELSLIHLNLMKDF